MTNMRCMSFTQLAETHNPTRHVSGIDKDICAVCGLTDCICCTVCNKPDCDCALVYEADVIDELGWGGRGFQ